MSGQIYFGTINYMSYNPPLVSLRDAQGKTWPCSNEASIIAAGLKEGDRVSFTRRRGESQTAHDVSKA